MKKKFVNQNGVLQVEGWGGMRESISSTPNGPNTEHRRGRGQCRRRRRRCRRDGDKRKNKRISEKTETNEKNERVRSAIAAGSGRFVMRIMGFKSALRSRDV